MANYGNSFGGSQGRNYGLVDGQISQSADSFSITAWVGLHQDYNRDNYTYYGYLEGSHVITWTRPSKSNHWSGAKTFYYNKYHNSQSAKITATVTTHGGTSTANYWFTIPAKDSYSVYLTIDKGQSYNNVEAQTDGSTALTLTKWYNETLTLPTTIPVRTGYTFLGWSKDKVQPGASVTYNGNWTMPAQWEANTYKVNFNLNQGTWPLPEYIERTYDKEFSIPNQIPTRKYYKFLGWTTIANSNIPQYSSGVQLKDNLAEDITLYACWELQSVNVYVYKPEMVVYDKTAKKYTYIYGEPKVEQGIINTNFTLTDLSLNLTGYEATGRLLLHPQEHFMYFGEFGIGEKSLPITQLDFPYHVYMEVRDAKQSSLKLTETKFDWVASDYTQDEYAEYLYTGDYSKVRKVDKTTTCVIAYIFNCTQLDEIGTSVNTDETYIFFKNNKNDVVTVNYEFKQYLNEDKILVIAKVEHVDISNDKSYNVSWWGMFAFDTIYVSPYIVDSFKRPIMEFHSFDIVSESIIYDIAPNKKVFSFGAEADNNKSNLVQSHWDLELLKEQTSMRVGILSREEGYQLDELFTGIYFVGKDRLLIKKGNEEYTRIQGNSIIYVTTYKEGGSSHKTIYSIPLAERSSSGLVKQQLLLDTVYPVGSIYMNVNKTKPTAYGMEWTQITGRVLIGSGKAGYYWEKIADEIKDTTFTLSEESRIRYGLGEEWTYKTLDAGTYTISTEFINTEPDLKKAVYKRNILKFNAGELGGSLEHSHKYGVEYGEYYGNTTLFGRNAGVLNNGVNSARLSDQKNYPAQISDMNRSADSSYNPTNIAHYRNIADTSSELSYPPYKVVNMWIRTK